MKALIARCSEANAKNAEKTRPPPTIRPNLWKGQQISNENWDKRETLPLFFILIIVTDLAYKSMQKIYKNIDV